MLKILIISLFLAGCSQELFPVKTSTGIKLSGSEGEALVQEITLNDGTKCATLIGYTKGAITCNWKN